MCSNIVAGGGISLGKTRFTFPREYLISFSAIVVTAGPHRAALPSNTLARGWEGDRRVHSNPPRIFQSLEGSPCLHRRGGFTWNQCASCGVANLYSAYKIQLLCVAVSKQASPAHPPSLGYLTSSSPNPKEGELQRLRGSVQASLALLSVQASCLGNGLS